MKELNLEGYTGITQGKGRREAILEETACASTETAE